MYKCEGLFTTLVSFLTGIIITILFGTGLVLIGTVTVWIFLALAALIFLITFFGIMREVGSRSGCMCKTTISVIVSSLIAVAAFAWLLSYSIVAASTGVIILIFIGISAIVKTSISLIQLIQCRLRCRGGICDDLN